MHNLTEHNCKFCNKIFFAYKSNKRKYCSIKCKLRFYIGKPTWNKGKHMWQNKKHPMKGRYGEVSPAWKGGRTIVKGYVCIYKPDHPYAFNHRYVLEHRLIMEKHLGRYLKTEERVHHINQNTLDNHIKNLMVFNNDGAHRGFHKGYNINKKYIIFDGRFI